MSKRQATSVLTHDNWDQDDPDEDPGTFEVAAKDVLNQRQIRVAKRRIPAGATNGDQPKASTFAGFSGFGVNTDKKASTPNFSFLTNGANTGAAAAPASSASTTTKSVNFFSTPSSQASTASLTSSTSTPSSAGSQKKEYLEKLKSLNEEVLSWLSSEVKKNPYCVLTPVFDDYKRHLADIQKDNQTATKVEEKTEQKKEEKREESAAPKQPVFSLFPTTTPFAKKDDAKPSFSFGLKPSQPEPEKTKPKEDEEAQDSDEDTPPKVEIVEVKEDNCVHQIRCKLFYKKDKAFQDKGVGTLYIKQNQGKSQLLVRADTSLGTILLNIALTQGLPIQKSGKNNIMIVCVPNPPIDPKSEPVPTPMLIRVKTEADADELLSKLNEITS